MHQDYMKDKGGCAFHGTAEEIKHYQVVLKKKKRSLGRIDCDWFLGLHTPFLRQLSRICPHQTVSSNTFASFVSQNAPPL